VPFSGDYAVPSDTDYCAEQLSYHAEHVGSMLRPSWLLEARSGYKQGRLGAEKLRDLEDRAVLEAIELQHRAGIEVLTDGELRRDTWMAGLLESTGGVIPAEPRPVRWRRNQGTASAEETRFNAVTVTEKVTRKATHTSVEAAFLTKHSPGTFKITMISASMGGMLWEPGLSDRAYAEPGELVRDLVALQIEEIEELIDQGVQWIQLDSRAYNHVFDGEFRAAAGLGAVPPDVILDAVVTADAEVVRAAKRKDRGVTVGMHICRGNNRGAWMASGSYEPVAERLFGEVGADRYLLEYDTERAGGFEPLRFVPPGTTIVLGLVSSKDPDLESQDDLRHRIDQAARYVPIGDLALSPQCGFASTARGNRLTIDEERRKLELVSDTARKVWG
jgi:5-methyltetrahydropteroyltriglutamate--homocysteine methyltransferase